MKPYTPEQCQAFLDSAKKLLDTNQTMQDIYETLTSLHGDETAAIYFDDDGKIQKYSYNEYKTKTFYLAQKLSTTLSGTPGGSVIGLKIHNCPEWPLLFWAILMTGHKPLLIDAKLAHENTQNLLNQAKAKAIIANESGEEYSVPCYRLIDIRSNEANYNFIPSWDNKVMFCSSGTTGAVKLFVYDGKALCGQILASLDIPQQSVTLMHPGKINILAMIPFHHVFGFMVVFLWYQFYGKAVVYPHSINSRDLIYACKKGKVTHIYSVPLFWDGIAQVVERNAAIKGEDVQTTLRRLLDYNTGKISKKEAGIAASKFARKHAQKKVLGTQVQYCISGGGYLNPKTLMTINGLGYPLYNGYGMTELGITSVEQSDRIKDRLRGSIGRPFHGVEYKIKGDGKQGELLVKCASVHTERIIDGKVKPADLDENGFFATGDIAEVDKRGRYYIRGRIKDVIINANGENVYPDELEIYFKNIHHVLQNVVVGIKEKDSTNETITLVLELDNSVVKSDLEKIHADFDALNASLPNEKKVKRALIYKKQLPLANQMKVKRYIIKEALEKGNMSDFLDWSGEEPSEGNVSKRKAVDLSTFSEKEVRKTLDKIKEIWSKILIVPAFKIEDNSDFEKDLGGDSMSYVAMVQDLNKEFKVTIPLELYGNLLTVDSFAEEVLTLLHPKKKEKKSN